MSLAVTSTTPLEKIRWAISDTLTIAKRNLLAIVRIPTALVFAVLQPIMFVLLFRYVFGGAIHAAGTSYVNFLIPGILVQTTVFGAVGTAIGLAEDLQRGLVERFRALPMARMAVLAGRTISDLIRNALVVVIITLIGLAVGFRPGGGVLAYIQASLLMLVFAFCLSWGFAFIGLAAPNSETAQAMTFPLIFPITFASSIFVPVSSMPGWLQAFANNQPVSMAAKAVRGLMLGPVKSVEMVNGHPVVTTITHGNATWLTLGWSALIVALLAPLATRKYRKAA